MKGYKEIMPKKSNRILILIRKIIFMMIGATLVSVALEMFLIPNNLVDGGIVGISIISSHITKISLGVFTFIFNIPFLVIGYKQIGKTFTLSTLFSVACLSVGVSIIGPFSGLTKDVLLASVFGGIILGTGVGLIIRNGGSLDGTEIIAIILDKRTGFSIGEIVMFFNIFILSAAGLVFGWNNAMYSLIAYFIAFRAIDIVVEGVDESKAVIIISEDYINISEAIRDRLGRGVTLLSGKSELRDDHSIVIYTVVTRLEIAKLKLIVHGFDENALVTISKVEVFGHRYKKKAIH